MPILTPTKATGSTSKTNPILYVEPAQTVNDADLQAQLAAEGLNSAFIVDFLSACLTHERCGAHLYRSVAGRTNNPVLKRKYEEFGDETLRHVAILEQVIATAGGNPSYVSPLARAVEASDSKMLEATYATTGGLDPMAMEVTMLDAVFMAESIDHANWETIGQLTRTLPEGAAREALEAAVAEVEPDEDEHLAWAKDTRARVTMMHASSTPATKTVAKLEELVAQVKDWFRGAAGSSNGSGPTGSSAQTRATPKKAAGKKTPAKKTTAPKQGPAKRAAAKKPTAAKKTAAKKAPAKKTTAGTTGPAKRSRAKLPPSRRSR